MNILGGDQRSAGFLRKIFQPFADFSDFGNIRMVADFQKEIFFAENVLVFSDGFFGFFKIVV